jgi:RNA-splicing ligase RtcB
MIDTIDDMTRSQIQGFLDHPAFENSYIAIMPDCHAGKGAVIGMTMKINEFVIPNVIGVDIGCGMLSARFDQDELNCAMLDSFIKRNIPSGFAINKDFQCVEKPQARDVSASCARISIDAEKALKAIGSLGGGNHFIEAGYDSQKKLWITIHSGSRNFGWKVAEFYQKMAKHSCGKHDGDRNGDLSFLRVDSPDGQNYFQDLQAAQRFASSNREEMLNRIISFIGETPTDIIESVHNFIGDDNVIRKGATPARKGEKVIIPFNMRDGLALCVGKGNAQYNNSAPHGAGRIMSRAQAKKQLSVSDFRKEMSSAGIFTTTATARTLDEAPGAYKDKEIILENIKDTVEIIDMVKPVYNFKAEGD